MKQGWIRNKSGTEELLLKATAAALPDPVRIECQMLPRRATNHILSSGPGLAQRDRREAVHGPLYSNTSRGDVHATPIADAVGSCGIKAWSFG
jgi:hypothetical protein